MEKVKVPPSLVHRLFYPQVPLVMAARKGDRVSAMPVVAYSSVSEDPPIVSVACSPRGFTTKLAVGAGAFSLSVVDLSDAGAVSRLATISGAKTKDKLAAAGLSHSVGRKLRVPVVDKAMATLECRILSKRKVGDHLLLTASVETAHASKAFGSFWDYRRYRPILYAGWKDGLATFPEG